MISLLLEFTRNLGKSLHLIVMDEQGFDQPRSFNVRPAHLLGVLIGSVFLVTVVILSLLLFTPVRGVLPGYGTIQMRRDARLNQLRMKAMSDSLQVQTLYVEQLRKLMLGTVDVSHADDLRPPDPELTVAGEPVELPETAVSKNWTDHQQPALSVTRLTSTGNTPPALPSIEARYLAGVRFPVLPPVTGLVTRRFDARTGHYAIDIAEDEGSVVRAIADGYVIMADWTHDGGQIIAIQHADGFVTVYKHNSRLLKRVGDRVRDREAVALSGNSGEITSGPHVHFELWHNGLAQDPSFYVIGLF
jgi:murein DD-endopeptidase MepM/ murein hydrolase activator NlpD